MKHEDVRAIRKEETKNREVKEEEEGEETNNILKLIWMS